jgi:SEC-C motif
MRMMCDLLKRGQAPAEIIQHYSTEDAKRGRNEACRCGSGRKWKHCHGSADAKAAGRATGDILGESGRGAADARMFGDGRGR